MSKNLALLMLFFISACSPIIIREEPAPQATPESWVTQADIDYAENFAASIFTDEEWTGEISIHADRVMHTWMSNQTSSVANLDYRVYAEGYPQATLEAHFAEYYSEETFKTTLFKYYDNLEQIAECHTTNLSLYEFRADYKSLPYLIQYWVDTSTPSRVSDFSMIFPVVDETKLDALARALFPSLPSCP